MSSPMAEATTAGVMSFCRAGSVVYPIYEQTVVYFVSVNSSPSIISNPN